MRFIELQAPLWPYTLFSIGAQPKFIEEDNYSTPHELQHVKGVVSYSWYRHKLFWSRCLQSKEVTAYPKTKIPNYWIASTQFEQCERLTSPFAKLRGRWSQIHLILLLVRRTLEASQIWWGPTLNGTLCLTGAHYTTRYKLYTLYHTIPHYTHYNTLHHTIHTIYTLYSVFTVFIRGERKILDCCDWRLSISSTRTARQIEK